MLGVAFLGELASGLLPASTPDLAAGLGVSGATAAALALSAPLALSVLVEPRLFVAADRARDRRGYVRAGLLAMAAGCLAAAVAPLWAFAVVLALCAPLWGVGDGVAQVALVEQGGASAARLLTRWTLAAAVGDVAAPVVLVAASLAGLDWRAAFLFTAFVAVANAALVPRLPRGAAAPGDEPIASTRAALAVVARSPRLAAWIAGAFLCTLLDEIFVAFAALAIVAEHGHAPGPRALILGAFLAGGVAGLLVQDRVLARVAPRRVLLAIAAVCTAAYAGWLLAPSLPVAAVLAGIVGATVAGQHPLAMSFAYRAAGPRPGVVNAALSVLAPLEVALPIGLAVLAAHAGVHAALAVLALQPIGLLALALLVPVPDTAATEEPREEPR